MLPQRFTPWWICSMVSIASFMSFQAPGAMVIPSGIPVESVTTETFTPLLWCFPEKLTRSMKSKLLTNVPSIQRTLVSSFLLLIRRSKRFPHNTPKYVLIFVLPSSPSLGPPLSFLFQYLSLLQWVDPSGWFSPFKSLHLQPDRRTYKIPGRSCRLV